MISTRKDTPCTTPTLSLTCIRMCIRRKLRTRRPGPPGAFTASGTSRAACRRICSYALLEETATGKKLAHFNTHLDHIGVKAQLEGARLVASQARKFAGIPTILTGDFNVFPYSEPYMAVIESGFTDARKQAALSTDQFTFHNFGEPLDGAERRETIDYIFTRNIETVSSFTVLTDRPDGKYPSDHDPVVAEFEL